MDNWLNKVEILKEFNCLEKSQELLLPYFLEASAGTGKTFAIEHIVTRLVLEHGIPIQQIVVVTFTKAATRELKFRIRKRIEISERVCSSKQNDSSLKYLNDVDEGIKKIYQQRAQKALCFFDEAEIYTIHGFCSKVLREYFFEAGQSLSSEEDQYIQLLKNEIYHVLQTDLHSNEFSISQLETYFKSAGKNVEDITKRLLDLILKGASFPEIPSFKQTCLSIDQSLLPYKKDLIDLDLLEGLKILGEIFKGLLNKKKELKEEYISQILILKELVIEGTSSNKLDELLGTGELFLEKLSEDNLKKNAKKNPEDVAAYSLFLRLRGEFLDCYREASDITHIELRIAKLCQTRTMKALESLDVRPPDDLLKQMQKALLHKEFLQAVKAKYKAALIDEFQDTDPIQWEIFSKLFKSEENFPLFLIGDPKQSIYGFRNADLKTYLEAKKSFSPEQRFSLGTNYRSEAPVIKALNILFSQDHSRGWLSHDETLIHTDVKVGKDRDLKCFQDQKASVHFGIFEGKKAIKNWPSKEVEEKSIFPWIVGEIQSLKKQGVSFGDMSILVKDRFQARRVENYLKSFNISCYSKNRAHIATTKAFSFVRALIKALDKPFDQSLSRLALLHPYIGLTSDDLIEESKRFTKDQIYIRWLSKEMKEVGFESMWQNLVKLSFVENLSFYDRLCLYFEESDYQDLEKMIQLLLERKKSFNKSPRHLLQILDEIESFSENEQDFVKRPVLGGASSVKIMTTHMSKGLEFDIVFALGIASKSKRKEKLLKLLKQNSAHIEAISPDNHVHQDILKSKNFEKSRLLYVALTRAKKRVYIPAPFETDPVYDELEMSSLELFLSKFARGVAKKHLIQKLEELGSENVISYEVLDRVESPSIYRDDLSQSILEKKPKCFDKNFPIQIVHSFSSLTANHDFEGVIPSQEGLLSTSILGVPASKQTGIILHALLEKLIERGCYLLDDERIDSLTNSQLKFTHLEEYSQCIFQSMKKLFSVNLPDIDKSLKEIEQNNLVTETEFFFLDKNKGRIRGIIDLILIDKNRFYIIDWKTNFLGRELSDYSQLTLKSYISAQKYDFQAALYANSIQRYLKNHGELEFGGAFYFFLRALEFDISPVVFLNPDEMSLEMLYE